MAALFFILVLGAFAYFFMIRPNIGPEAQKRKEKAAKKQAEQQEELQKEVHAAQHVPLSALAKKDDIINLKPKEYIYYVDVGPVTWSEHRTKTTKVNYGGLTANVKIMKGLHYRAGSLRTGLQKSDYIKDIFTGAVILTNRRIVLYDDGQAKAYPFTRLLNATAYSDGTVLSSNSGKEVMLSGFRNAQAFNIYLRRLTVTDENPLPKKK